MPGEPTPYVYNYEYDSLTGLLDTLTYPTSTSGYRLALKYNVVGGILRSITDASSPNTVFWSLNDAQGGINALGQITHDRLGPIVRERQYDAVTGGLERLTAGSSGNPTALQNLSIGYDDLGNVSQRQNNLGSLPAGLTENFQYGQSGIDLLDRLTQIDVTNAEGTRTREIGHDAFGNIELVTTPDSAVPPDLLPVDLTFTWTSNNYPKTISAPWLSQSVSFAYGPHQQRWRMTFKEGDTTETTYYLGLMEKVVTGAGTEFRHHIPGPDEIVALYARSGSTGSLRYVLSDHLGSIDTITDSAGAALVRASFAAYGRPRDAADWWGEPGSTASGFTRQGFTFQTVLADMGLTHMNGRVHDAISGTFVSADPFVPDPTNTQSFNRYAYVRNNPLTYTDPSGFEPRGCQNCIWGMIGDSVSGMGPLEWGYALWERYGGWKGYMWATAGIDTGDYDCKGSFEECSRGWVASEFYTNEVTNPRYREFPAERRSNTNVAAGTSNPGVDRRSAVAAGSTVGGMSTLDLLLASGPTISPYRPLFRDNFAGRTFQSIDYGLGWVTQAFWDGPVRGLFSNQVPSGRELNDAKMGVVLAAVPLSRLSAGAKGGVASVDELLAMMNKRPGVTAEYATGDALAYLQANQAAGSHMLFEGGRSSILLRQDLGSRWTAFHEWLHRALQRRTGGPRPGEDEFIEAFLERHKAFFRLEE